MSHPRSHDGHRDDDRHPCPLPGAGPDGEGTPEGRPTDLDEQALRRLLQGAVGELEPSTDALEQLRRAVPARRTRRRQAAVGVAAAVIFGIAAMPALIHVATTVGTADDRPANAASSRQRTHEMSDGRHGGRGEDGRPGESTAGPDAGSHEEDRHGEEGKKDGSASGPSGFPGAAAPAPGPTLAASSPTCDRKQLGKGAGSVAPADKDGRVYGAFRVVNVSSTVCAVAGSAGVVAAQAQGSAESSRVTVVDHTVGDAATGLPDPATEPTQVILQPGQAYEIKFAWVPSADGGPSGCSKPAAPSPAPPASPSSESGTATKAEEGTQTTQDTAPAKPPASVVLSHTPDAGEPKAADTTIPDACAGTIYRTGALAAAPAP